MTRRIRWGYKGRRHVSVVLPKACPMCGVAAVVELPAPILAEQPDETTHVCHPMAGGCNHGFARDDAEDDDGSAAADRASDAAEDGA